MNELMRVAEYVSQIQYDDLPEKVRDAITYCILDTIGASLGAHEDTEICCLTHELLKWGGSSEYMASVWGRNVKTDVHTAVLLNAMAGHTLEMDDGHGRSKAHIGVVVIPTGWAMAEALKKSGKELLAACVAGYETMTRIGIAMDVASNRKKGWHTTGIIGTFGAAAVSSRLLGLNAEQTANAFGIAGTQSAGLWAFLKEGSTLKKLNPARAAVNGMEAALLAKGGMTGPRHALDAEDGGLYRAVSESFDMREVSLELGERYETLMIEKKLYPSCASTHHAVDAAVDLYKKGIRPKDIEDVLIECNKVAYIQCGDTKYPETWVEAKFSIPYTFATALKHGTVTNDSFNSKNLSDKEVYELASKVRTSVNDKYSSVYPGRLMGKAVVRLKNGNVIENEMDGMVGSPMKPISKERIVSKYLGLTQNAIGEEKATEIMHKILCIANNETVFSI